MAPTFSALALAAVACTVAFAPAVSAAARPPTTDHRTYKLDDNQANRLPDFTDPKDKIKLKCSACLAVAREAHHELEALHKLRHGKPKHYEIVDKLEHLCLTLRDKYGLLMKNNFPTPIFSKDPAISRTQGSWINTYMESRCGEIMSRHEDLMIEQYERDHSLEKMEHKVCGKLMKVCPINHDGEMRRHDEL